MRSNSHGKRKQRSDETALQRERRLLQRRITYNERQQSIQQYLNEVEYNNMNIRMRQIQENTNRNETGQNIIVHNLSTHQEENNQSGNYNDNDEEEKNIRNFFSAIDEPLTAICGCCGELANLKDIVVIDYDPDSPFFFTIAIPGGTGLIDEAFVDDENGKQKITFCKSCYGTVKELREEKKPKFCKAAGFDLGYVPEELSRLNNIESRMIGLGICFTSCYRLKGGGQHGSRGNSISYWNQTSSIVRKLPRPISKCEVIHLRTSGERTTVYQVRPNYIRAALYWLIQNNPLYKTVEIDEELLNELQESYHLPDLIIDESDVETNTGTDHEDTNNELNDSKSINEFENELNHTFEMPTGNLEDQTETDRILRVLVDYNTDTVESVSVPPLNVTMNEFTDKYYIQQCFPTLFPYGRGGINPIDTEERLATYKLAEYCSHLMTWHDRRFVMHPTFKFFCLNLIQRRQIDGLTRKASNNRNQDREVQNANDDQIKKLLQELKPYFKSVRGTGLYWSGVRSELLAMLGNDALPVRWPTFFFTLSAADTIWPDFFRVCNPSLSMEQASNLSQQERYSYLNQYPDLAARHFYRRFKALMSEIILGDSQPLGHVIDYFWRVEFQKRGSPHIHGLLWVEGAPDVNELCKSETGRSQIVEFVDKYVHSETMNSENLTECTCQFCDNERNNIDNPDILTQRLPNRKEHLECHLRRVVERVQQHVCFPTSACRVKKGVCRFLFPKKIRRHTEVEVETISEGVHRIHIHTKRTNPYINQFNKKIIVLWKSNMDISFIGNAYGAAEYTAKYVSKSEPDTSKFRNAIRKALDRSEGSTNSYTTLRRVANAIIAAREVSAQEALWILLPGLNMTEKSRSIVKVKTLRHNKRSHWVSRDECIQMAVNPNYEDDNASRLDPLERMYMARPKDEIFCNMSYKYFCQHYEESKQKPNRTQLLQRFNRTDSLGHIKQLKKPHVIVKCPSISADINNPDYCFQELLLRTSWYNISDLPVDDDDCVNKFATFRESSMSDAIDLLHDVEREEALQILQSEEPNLTEQNRHYRQFAQDTLLDSVPSVQTEMYHSRSVRICSPEEYDRAEKFIINTVIQVAESTRSTQQRSERISPYMYPIGMRIDMNDDQWLPFAICMKQSRARYKASVTNRGCTPIRIILNGEGGSGKSWLIEHIVKDTYQVFDKNQKQNNLRVLLLAHQGTAAFNINGNTICSALAIPRYLSNTYLPLSADTKSLSTLKRLQEKYENVHLVIIDEFSVIPCTLLYWIDQRLREIFPYNSDDQFGGRDIIFAGDMGQLKPVLATSLSTPEEHLTETIEILGRKIWTGIDTVCTLRSQNRGSHDVEWYDALRRLRTMDQTDNDLKLFNTRVKSTLLQPTWIHNAMHIAYTNEKVNATNRNCIMQQPNEVLEFNSYYNYYEKDRNDPTKITKEMIDEVREIVTQQKHKRDAVIAPKIQLAIGAVVSLTYNVAQVAGLCNGTKGIVHDIITCSDKKLPIILVRITDKYIGPSFLDIPNIVPIPPRTVSCNLKHEFVQVSRVGIPLRLAYGMTIHKVQGLTCPKVVFDPSSIPTSAFAYVALSRVRKREDIILTQPIIINHTQCQTNDKQILQRECSRLDQFATRTRAKHQLLINTMRIVAIRHNQLI